MKKYVVREVMVKGEEDVIIIEYDDRDSKVWIPSRLTDFIYRQYMNKALNTKVKAARTIVEFMNYLIREVNSQEDESFKCLEVKGMYALDFNHAAKYLNYCFSKGNSQDTVDEKEKILVKFYSFLYSAGITSTRAKPEQRITHANCRKVGRRYTSRKGVMVNISPFKNKQRFVIKRPKANRKRKIKKDLDYEVWTQLIEYAEKYYPQIAFGVAIQCMGGLRQGEVVNLSIEDVKALKDENIIMLNIEQRPILFIDRKIKMRKSQTKKDQPMDQVVFNWNDRLFEIYENHLKYISKNANVIASKLQALFIDSRGNSMTGDTYEYNFRKLKKDFIEEVDLHSPSCAKELKGASWGSHIGRHVFTNYLIKTGAINDSTGQPDKVRLKLLRRDVWELTSEEYMDKIAIAKAVYQNMNKMGKMAKYDEEQYENILGR